MSNTGRCRIRPDGHGLAGRERGEDEFLVLLSPRTSLTVSTLDRDSIMVAAARKGEQNRRREWLAQRG